MTETYKVHDPFIGQDVEVSNRLTDRLRGKYAQGPMMPNGEPEFGWREFAVPPIQHEAAAKIELLEAALRLARAWCMGQGYDAQVTVALRTWVDGGMTGELPADPHAERKK